MNYFRYKQFDKDVESAIKETSKYSVKSSDFLTDNDKKIKKLSVI